MKTLLISTLILSAFVAAATAGEYKLPKDEPVVSFTIPAKWKIEKSDESISATSADDEILVSFEINDGDSLEGAIEESLGFLKKNKVKIDKDSQKKQEMTVRGMEVVNFDWKGTDEDGPTKISLTIMGITKGKALVLLYWASPEGEKKHAADHKTIQDSIKPITK
jgi:predicted Zn-dependent protease